MRLLEFRADCDIDLQIFELSFPEFKEKKLIGHYMVAETKGAKDNKTKVKIRLTQNRLVEIANKHGVEIKF